MPGFSSPSDGYPPEFVSQLKVDSILDIFCRYQKGGGDPRLLGALLWQFKEGRNETSDPSTFDIPKWFKPNLRRFKTEVGKCRRSLAILIELNPYGFLMSQLQTTDDLLAQWQEAATQSNPEGRPSGPMLESLLLAMLAATFRQVFGGPRYTDIETLAKTFSQISPVYLDKDHIRQRIKSVPKEDAISRSSSASTFCSAN